MDGIVLVNKPKGISSNKVVNIVKYSLGAKKCGHLGTLDLEGEGLLPVTVNHATKLFDCFLHKDKTYETVFQFGFETDTLDFSGKIVTTSTYIPTQEEIENVLPQFIGKQLQMPPQYSAKKVNGKVGYKVARQGGSLELSPKEIEIYDFKLLQKISDSEFKFSISCSSGTYIRSICRDLAYKLSTYGSMQCILRTKCGNFYLRDAFNLEDIEKGICNIIPCQDLFDLPIIELDDNQFFKISNGQNLFVNLKNGDYKLFYNEQFLGIGIVTNEILSFKLRLF